MPAPTVLWTFVAVVAVCAALAQLGVHRIREGNIGVYWRGGALLRRVTHPGFHLKVPLLDQHAQVQVTLQTDSVRDIPCGTSGGVMLNFARVEVVNRLSPEHVFDTIKQFGIDYDKPLIYDRLHHELNQFCSKHTLQQVYIDLFHTVDDMLMGVLQESLDKWAPGIQIIAVRVTKPVLPASVLRNYELMEAEKTKLLLAVQQQRVAEKEAETERKKATIHAEKLAAVSTIEMEQQIREREARKKMALIEDEQMLHRQRAVADAAFYERERQAAANKLVLTPEYLALEQIRALANNSKVYFGERVGSMFALLEAAKDVLPKMAT